MSLNTPRFSVILVGLSLAFLGPQVGGCNEAPELEEPLVCDNLLQAPELTTESLQVHMAAFSDAASIHGGNRAGGSPGFDASADYAQEVLEAAGYTVTRNNFEFQKYEVLAPPTLVQDLPNARSYTLWQDFVLFRFGRSGDASGRVVPVAVDLDNLDEVGTSGCEPADFNDFPSGEIALIRRGGCPHEQKALHAQDAGAIGVIEFNNVGDTLFDSRFSPTSELAIPVLFVTETLGLEFAQQSLAEDLYMTMHVETSIETATTFNLIADHPGGDPEGPV
ncbi:MAG: PA domain-containing protein, partial [Nannocystaceae bacterium]